MLEYVDDIEDCVQDLLNKVGVERKHEINMQIVQDISKYIARICLLYTSDAADE